MPRSRATIAFSSRSRAVAAITLCAGLAACAREDGRIADAARTSVVGYSQKDIRMCAGFPTQTYKDGATEFWSYKGDASSGGGIAVSTPLAVVPGLSQTTNVAAPSGSCSMQVRFVQGRVAEIAYSGDTDMAGVAHAFCAPLIRNCLSYKPTPVAQPIVPLPQDSLGHQGGADAGNAAGQA